MEAKKRPTTRLGRKAKLKLDDDELLSIAVRLTQFDARIMGEISAKNLMPDYLDLMQEISLNEDLDVDSFLKERSKEVVRVSTFGKIKMQKLKI